MVMPLSGAGALAGAGVFDAITGVLDKLAVKFREEEVNANKRK